MVAGRLRVLLLGEELCEGPLLCGRRLEDEQHAFGRQAVGGHSAIELGSSQGVDAAIQDDAIAVVDRTVRANASAGRGCARRAMAHATGKAQA